jgi:hypothetical protein
MADSSASSPTTLIPEDHVDQVKDKDHDDEEVEDKHHDDDEVEMAAILLTMTDNSMSLHTSGMPPLCSHSLQHV